MKRNWLLLLVLVLLVFTACAGPVFVIDLESSQIINRIDIGLGARTVIVSRDESLAYVSRASTHYDKGGLVIIDTSRDEVIDRMDNPPEEWGLLGTHDPLVITPNGKFLLWEFSQPKIKIIEIETNRLVKTMKMFDVLGHTTFEMGMAPHGPAFNSDGSCAYFALGDCYLLMIADTSTWTMIDYVSGVGCDPQDIAYNTGCQVCLYGQSRVCRRFGGRLSNPHCSNEDSAMLP